MEVEKAGNQDDDEREWAENQAMQHMAETFCTDLRP